MSVHIGDLLYGPLRVDMGAVHMIKMMPRHPLRTGPVKACTTEV